MAIQVKRGTNPNWTGVLSDGQPSILKRQGKSPRLKFGDGSTKYNLLPYAAPDLEIYQDTGIVYSGDLAFEIASPIGLDVNILTSGYHFTTSGFYSNQDLGTNDHRWNAGYITNLFTESITSTDTSGLQFYTGSASYLMSPTEFYPSASQSLGISDSPWDSTYSNKYLSGSNTAMTFGFADGTTAFSVGRSPAAIVPSNVVNNLGISSNPWTSIYIGNRSGNANDVISLTYNSLAIGTGNGALETTTSKDRTFTIWNKMVGPGPGGSYTWRNDVAVRVGCDTGGMYYDKTYRFAADKGFYVAAESTDNGTGKENGLNLGTSDNPWNKLFLGEMVISYNSTEEAIEFLAN